MALGIASVLTVLAVTPVSLHTLLAAALLALLAAIATFGGRAESRSVGGTPARQATAGV